MRANGLMQAAEKLSLSSGRAVTVHEAVTGTGPTVVLCHPAGGSGAFDPVPEVTAARAVTLLAVDRPGYGGSDPLPAEEWATVDSAAGDLAQVLDARGATRVGLAGWGEGGWTAAALAAHRPDLVDRLVLIATPAPHDQRPYLPAQVQAQVSELRDADARRARAEFARRYADAAVSDPYGQAPLDVLYRSAVDDEALAVPGARDRLAGMFQQAYAQKTAGIAADLAGSLLRPWGFDPPDVAAKTLLLYGQSDPVAPGRHATWWLANVRNGRVESKPKAGHLLILTMWARALAHLAPRSRA